ncbi:MAG TPA: TetR/AcrR family transcriptional regulator [Bacillales bacterium]|nr:TetR/AcrR family transcriptional regulator [Bacillales bacterium]
MTKMPNEARDKMLYAALCLFSTKGLKETSVLEIVERARVSKTTFYQHFKGKEELLVSLCRQLAEEIIEEIERAIEPEQSITAKAYAGICRYIKICTTRKMASHLLLVSSVGISGAVENIRRDAHQRLARLIFQTVHKAVSTQVSDQEIRIVSQAMIGAINEVVVQSLMESDREIRYEQLARTLNQIVVGSFVNLVSKEKAVAGRRFRDPDHFISKQEWEDEHAEGRPRLQPGGNLGKY